MKERSVYTSKNYRKISLKKNLLFRLVFLSGLFFMSMATVRAEVAPVFAGGSPQTLTVCENSGANDISSLLNVNDPDVGQTETWSIFAAASNGALTVSYITTSTGGTLVPSGITYTPNAGYSGSDAFTIQVSDGNGGTATTVINVTVNAQPTIVLGTVGAVCQGTITATLPFVHSVTFNYTGGAQSWAVPAGLSNVLALDVQGARGGYRNGGTGTPGYGGRVQGNITATTGEVINLFVGGAGGTGSVSGATGGYNGGGTSVNYGGAGGGASDVRIGGTALANRVAIAGGGGGGGADGLSINGGNGGGLIGANGGPNTNAGTTPAGGGTQTAGGVGAYYPGWGTGSAGAFTTGGEGLNTPGSTYSGGGGGGYYGGGGGVWSGGGGGSSYTDGSVTSVVHTQGYNNNNGLVTISYLYNGTYTIVWDAAAHTAGFTDVVAQAIPASEFTINVPVAVPAATYTGTLTINNGTCNSVPQTITVTVNPTPVLSSSPTPPAICSNTLFDYTPTSATTGTTFVWSRDTVTGISNPAANGNDNPNETLINTTTSPIAVTYVYTLTAGSCPYVQNVTVTVNPTPSLTTTLTPAAICDSTAFVYVPASTIPGTVITWNRDFIAGISNAATTGMDSVDEVLVNTTASPIAVVYMDSLTANGCLNVQNVTVTVNPRPVLISSLTPAAICDSTEFDYIPASATTGTTFTWSRGLTTGISNAGATGSDNPAEVLVNTTTSPIAVTYVYTLTANGCSDTQSVTVTVNPKLIFNNVSDTAVCYNMPYIYFTGNTSGATFTWSRDSVAGISNSAATGMDSVHEVLINTTNSPIVVTYMDTLSLNGCTSTQMVNVTVNPQLLLSSPLTGAPLCDGATFTYIPSSTVSGVTFAWSNASSGAVGVDNISEVLHNTTAVPATVTYLYTLNLNGCLNTQNVTVTVNPIPALTSTLNPSPICDSTLFSYVPTSGVSGATFNWLRPYVIGIGSVAATGTDNPDEYLKNNTYFNVSVAYIYTVSANGCSSVDTVSLLVRPTPTLTSALTGHVCSGTEFDYAPTSNTPLLTYAWSLAPATGITASATSGTGNINNTLTNNTTAVINVVYTYTLTIGSCPHTESITVSVNPTPAGATIAIMPPASVCSNTMYANFGAASAPDSGVTYTWSATNATVWATGADHQYALVNFDNTGDAVVTLTTSVNPYGCSSAGSSYTVNVGPGTSATPYVVYTRGQLVCLENDVTSYQWGYDDVHSLDSSVIAGQIDQSYTIDALDPNKYYWVMTTQNGCVKKSYYNTPTAITNVNNAEVAGIKVYPNPTSDYINVEINSIAGGNVEVDILNMLGQKLTVTPATGNKAQINVASLPAGTYLVNCMSNGVKIATAKFIKN